MRAVVQRVSEASVRTNGQEVGSIGPGLVVLLGVKDTDTRQEAEWLANKIIQLRVFDDSEGKMNLSLFDVSGQLLVVSQFTLFGDTRKGNRPSFIQAARPEQARDLYQLFVEQCRSAGVPVQTGVFQAEMQVYMVNEGPVTILYDTDNLRNT